MIDLQKNSNIIEIKNLIKKFDSNVLALNNISLSLKKGECLGIVGESGCGKSTLAKIITLIEKPTSGKIFFNGENIFQYKRKQIFNYHRNIQMVFQNPHSVFSPRMSIGQFLCEGLINYKIMEKFDAKKEALKLLKIVELNSSYYNKFPHELSGGELQRVVIARAISIKPDVLIYDEPTSSLDVCIQNNILKLLYKIQKEFNLSTIFIGHNIAVVRMISDRIMVMKNGEIVEVLDSENFLEFSNNEYTKTLIDATFDL